MPCALQLPAHQVSHSSLWSCHLGHAADGHLTSLPNQMHTDPNLRSRLSSVSCSHPVAAFLQRSCCHYCT